MHPLKEPLGDRLTVVNVSQSDTRQVGLSTKCIPCVSLEGASVLVLRRRRNDKQGQVGVRQSEQKQEDKKEQNQALPLRQGSVHTIS